MTRILPTMIVVLFMALMLGTKGDEGVLRRRDGVVVINWDQFYEWLCKNSVTAAWSPICGSRTTTTTTASSTTRRSTSTTSASPSMASSTGSTTEESSESEEETSSSARPSIPSTSTTASTTPVSPSVLARAHWCRFNNGTYIPLGYTFMHTECALCQCTPSREIWCTTLQCMPTFCIDGSTPAPRPGQCCPQCAYEKASTACVINRVSFPHGTVLRRTSDNVQCWCQLGSVECRRGTQTLFAGLDWWGKGSAVYVIVFFICALLFFGTLLCCGCTLSFYYYYKRRQQNAQQAYADYFNNAGWQAMPGGEEVVEGSAEEKQTEAEQGQVNYEYSRGVDEQYVPPPYALYNGSYVNEPSEQDRK